MTLTKHDMEDILSTKIKSLWDKEFKRKIKKRREDRIKEAVSFEPGPSTADPIKHKVNNLPDGSEVYFLKPGKETDRDDPNIHDMTPSVGKIYEDFQFDDTWSIISKTSIKDFEMFKFLLVLIYRNAYLEDHIYVDDENKKLRYEPSKDVMKCIEMIDDKIGGVLPKGGVLGLMNFLDVLGWNEDVKYHSEEGDYNLDSNFYVGRINTLLTSIRIPYQLSCFVLDVVDKADEPENIDFQEGLDTMQDLTVSRGVCKPSKSDLEEWFSPVLDR